MHHTTDKIAHTTVFVTPVVEHWLEQEIAQWVHHEGLIQQSITPLANALTTELHLSPNSRKGGTYRLFDADLKEEYFSMFQRGHLGPSNSLNNYVSLLNTNSLFCKTNAFPFLSGSDISLFFKPNLNPVYMFII